MTVKEELQKCAFEIAYPYIIKQPIIKDYFENLCFLLVGSVATGLCTEKSDVGIDAIYATRVRSCRSSIRPSGPCMARGVSDEIQERLAGGEAAVGGPLAW